MHIIDLKGLTKRYGNFVAVDNLDLTIQKGEVFGLLGPNGAGKSTTILMMLGLTEPTAGEVRVCGIDSTVNPIEVKRRVGYLPDDVGFYEHLSGRENLLYTARLNRLSWLEAEARVDRLLQRVGLQDAASKKAGKYSRGMRQRLGLADVLVKNPEVIILDEPTLGIDPLGVREFLELIVTLSREEHITVLLSSHHLHQVQQVCDRVGIFVAGKLLAQGNIAALSKALFSDGEPYIIEAGINAGGNAGAAEALLSSLRQLAGVVSVQFDEGSLRIGSTHDVTADVARAVVLSGLGLKRLSIKEYGLDDIYNRYFEGGEVYGKTA
ncbi:ABC-2 type transport system ATP-binding protein [Parapedobacter composti]|uniref:ABC-2 type transport system ATP-binding protein n=1 Tax=Parapedobacter composti TaxID=623281 RepID=A0A1I1KSQ9_9SPHI|nr:ABC transporter ATP-binding protein [Parapedobacter composti]SFC60480.1 ABC-2 type transport system ATP-binding protein [Parapedobacter composti]